MSSFIERFGIVGSAGVLGLMVVVGIYGFASLLGVEPDEAPISLPPQEEEVLPDADNPTGSARAEVLPLQASPTAPGETPPASSTPGPPDVPQPQAAVLAEARRAGGTGESAPLAATPAPLPGDAAAPPPAPAAPPSTPDSPAPTPGPSVTAECSAGGAPLLDEHNKRVRFSYGSVVSFSGSLPGVLVVDVSGMVLELAVTAGTDVRGVLSAATVVSGQGHRLNDGSIDGQYVEVVCP
jgi:hypothetical protein